MSSRFQKIIKIHPSTNNSHRRWKNITILRPILFKLKLIKKKQRNHKKEERDKIQHRPQASRKSSKSTQVIHHRRKKYQSFQNKKKKKNKKITRKKEDIIIVLKRPKTNQRRNLGTCRQLVGKQVRNRRGDVGNGGCTAHWRRSWLRIYEPMYTNEVISGYLTFHLSSYVALRVTRPQEWMRRNKPWEPAMLEFCQWLANAAFCTQKRKTEEKGEEGERSDNARFG